MILHTNYEHQKPTKNIFGTVRRGILALGILGCPRFPRDDPQSFGSTYDSNNRGRRNSHGSNRKRIKEASRRS